MNNVEKTKKPDLSFSTVFLTWGILGFSIFASVTFTNLLGGVLSFLLWCAMGGIASERFGVSYWLFWFSSLGVFLMFIVAVLFMEWAPETWETLFQISLPMLVGFQGGSWIFKNIQNSRKHVKARNINKN
eukprot:TRINITY_DN574_c0_g1_i2.p1 TRINITY_DN574_c0_g1~~TRINITY_DN574_c0_g1_i2.p1  ORF type:complete len:130 (-),score=13.58 TRINITY_DN574_c0_g1_i2:40-429(-)